MIWYLTGTGPGPETYDAVQWLVHGSSAQVEAWPFPPRHTGVRPDDEGWPELQVTTRDERTFNVMIQCLSAWPDVTWRWALIDGRPGVAPI